MTEPGESRIGQQTAKVSSGLLKLLLAVLVFSASVLVLTLPEDENTGSISNPVKDQIANQTIYSECEFLTEDFEQTRLAQQRAMNGVPLYYKRMDDASARIARQFQVFFEEIGRRAAAERADKPYSQPDVDKVDNASVYLSVQSLPPPDFQFFRRLAEDETAKQDFLQKVSDQILNKGVLAEKVRDSLQHDVRILIFDVVEGKIREFNPEPLARILSETTAGARAAELLTPRYRTRDTDEREQFKHRAAQLFSRFLTGGNLMPADDKTNAVREERKNEVKPLKRSFHIGDTLIKKQQKLTEEDLVLLADYKAARRQLAGAKSSWGGKAEKAALCLVFLLFATLYIARIHPALFRDDRKIWLLGCIAVAALLANRIFAGLYRSLLCEQGNFTPQLVFMALPLGLASGLISVICGLRAAICVGLFVSGVASIALNNSFPVVVTGLLVSGLASVAGRNVSDYKKYFTALFLACTFSTLFTGGIFLMDEVAAGELDVLRDACVLSAATGVITATLALVFLFVLETIFDVSTNMTYLACTDRNHPLLKRLQLEAPGTYHHSERVASIGEKAAGLIGANPLQVQACALFHDIGKLAAPGMFTENTGGGNPHQGLTPRESAEIIRKHVSFGLELARKNKLKKAIRLAIAQHHGTDFISFFYDLAKKNASGEPPDERDFRYPGPLPDSKETVVLSIADFAEAVSRSMPGLTEEELRAKLFSILRIREDNGQLDHAPVTMAEIRIVIDSLVSSLTAMNHVRIAYPSFSRDERKERK